MANTNVKLLPNSILGTLLCVLTEIMFFSGLLSAYSIIKSTNFSWAIPINVTLPVIITGINTGILIQSGILAVVSAFFLKNKKDKFAVVSLKLAGILGFIFVVIQGYEWLQLISYGFTMESGIFAGLFFLLIGIHGLHVLVGVIIMLYFAFVKTLALDAVISINIFWLFVVIVWPVIYGMVYF